MISGDFQNVVHDYHGIHRLAVVLFNSTHMLLTDNDPGKKDLHKHSSLSMTIIQDCKYIKEENALHYEVAWQQTSHIFYLPLSAVTYHVIYMPSAKTDSEQKYKVPKESSFKEKTSILPS